MIAKKRTLFRIVLLLILLWLILLGIFYFSSGKYRDHAINLLKTQLDKYLITEIRIDREDIHLSLFKNFPYASLDLNNILLKSAPGINLDDFHRDNVDTLLFARKVSLIFNLRSLLSKEYDLKKIEVDNALLNILSDKKGKVNYLIIKTSKQDSVKDSVSFDLRKITLQDISFMYQDLKNDILYTDYFSQAELTGTFNKDDFTIKAQAETKHGNLRIKGTSYLEHEPLKLNLAIDKGIGKYVLNNSEITVFGVRLNISGKYLVANNEYSTKFYCNAVSLQRTKNALTKFWSNFLILSPQNGDLNLRGTVSGKGSSNPAIALQFEVKNGVFKNAKKNVKITDLYLKGAYSNGTRRILQTSFLKIDSLSAQSGKSVLFLAGSIQNFNSPTFEGRAKGYIELQKLLIIEPLARKYELDGVARGNIQSQGNLLSVKNIRNQDIQRIKLNGILQLEDAYIKPLTNTLPSANISGNIKVISLTEISFSDINIHTGKSDLQMSGEVSNLPFFKNDKSVFPIYRCTVKSNEFHTEDFMPGSPKEEEKPFKIVFPDSLRIAAKINLKSFSFGKFSADNVSGDFTYNPKTIYVKNFSMETQEGTIKSDLRIDQTPEKLISECYATLNHVDMRGLFYAFNEFGQTVITHEYIDGYLSGSTHVKASWDFYLNPIYKDLSLTSQVTLDKGELIEYAPIMGLSDYIELDELKHVRFDRLQTSVIVDKGKVTIGQMQIKSSAITITGSGEHNFDNSYIYRFQVELSDILWKKARKRKPEKTEFGYVVDDGLGRHIIPLAITGKDTVFEVIYDKRTAGTIFQEKLLKEKQVWEELTLPTDSGIIDNQSDMRLEWEEEQPVKNTRDSIKTETRKNDFQIEWEDD